MSGTPHKNSSVGERRTARGGTTRPDECSHPHGFLLCGFTWISDTKYLTLISLHNQKNRPMEKEPGKKTGKGGAREGSGRKAVSGMYTKTMRIPTVMEEEVLCLIDMYSNWLKYGKMEKGMKRRTTPEQRMSAIRSIQEILDYEKQSQKAHKKEEEDKRQMSLF